LKVLRKSMHDNSMAYILVVEDNPDLLTMLRDVLSTEHQVTTARRGEEGIGAARARVPDLVIMDLKLPGMSGIEAGQWIKRELGDVPVLALTALAQEGDAEAVLRSGCCDEYMSKPASLDDIRRKVASLLEESTGS
jgi:CheY-like chemotaxis protein